MKWWGWGDVEKSFPMEDKPELWPWIRRRLALPETRLRPPVVRDRLVVPRPVVNAAFCEALAQDFAAARYTSDDDVRLYHCFGKSYPDLLAARAGALPRATDMVVFPTSHDEVERLVALAHEHDVCLIPFGGGTNIVGGIDPLASETRMIVTLDMRDMNRLVSVDPHSQVAVIQAGMRGPELEAALHGKGFSLGHFPDSFEFSTLGGWLATRSAGMQSDAYGRIEDMVLSMRMVTPRGTIETRPVPASSAGPDLNRMMCGSEGVLGVITEATMRVHPVPPHKDYRGFLFRSFPEGVAAIHACWRAGHVPSMIRLQDSNETELAAHMKAPAKGLAGFVQSLVKRHLKRRGYSAPCIMVVGFEGSAEQVRRKRSATLPILKKFGGFSLGNSIGDTWSKDKYNIPYLRDYVMDRGVMCDVAETATTWAEVVPLYDKTIAAVNARFSQDRGAGFIGCHISHSYETGACLYFTYAAAQQAGSEREQYYSYKNLITDVFMRNSATLTHHHAVGVEHMPWLEAEISPTGLRALSALKRELDPKSILNPGKLLG
jgi:alkyldihydroxyacetonephosphate synthase